MEAAVVVSISAFVLSAVGFFYKIGRDTKGEISDRDGKLDQLCKTTETINKKLDGIAEWQRKAAEIHATHEERIRTLFNEMERLSGRIGNLENRMEDRKTMTDALQKILERMG